MSTAGLFCEPMALPAVRALLADADFQATAFILVGLSDRWDAAAAQMPVLFNHYADAGEQPDEAFYELVAMLFLRAGRLEDATERRNRLVLSLPQVTKEQVQPHLSRMQPTPPKGHEPFFRILPEDRMTTPCPQCKATARLFAKRGTDNEWFWWCDACPWRGPAPPPTQAPQAAYLGSQAAQRAHLRNLMRRPGPAGGRER